MLPLDGDDHNERNDWKQTSLACVSSDVSLYRCTDSDFFFFLMYKNLCLFDRLFLFFLSIPSPIPIPPPPYPSPLTPQVLDPIAWCTRAFVENEIIFYFISFHFLCVDNYAVFVNRMQTLYVCTAGGAGVYRLSLEYCTVVFWSIFF
jgi:hypothetical protein